MLTQRSFFVSKETKEEEEEEEVGEQVVVVDGWDVHSQAGRR